MSPLPSRIRSLQQGIPFGPQIPGRSCHPMPQTPLVFCTSVPASIQKGPAVSQPGASLAPPSPPPQPPALLILGWS